jgi:CBS domain-containing protein
MKVSKLAQVPPPVVSTTDTVVEAVRIMQEVRVGAAVVLDGDQLAGIFSERDIMLRVVGAGKDPATTPVSEVMTCDPESVGGDTEDAAALELMVRKHIRHLPIVDKQGTLIGLVSIRNLLHSHVDDLVDQLNSIEAYFTADGPGG